MRQRFPGLLTPWGYPILSTVNLIAMPNHLELIAAKQRRILDSI